MICNSCGSNLKENEEICPNCGAVQTSANNTNDTVQNTTVPNPDSSAKMDSEFEKDSISEQEISDGKVMSVLSYLGCLILIPAIAGRKNRYSRYHLNQGLVLLITNIIANFFAFIPTIGTYINLAISLMCFVFMIIGIVNACTGKMKELPLIGKIKIVK